MKVVLFASLILMGLSWPLMWVSAKASAGTWPGSDEEKKLDAACTLCARVALLSTAVAFVSLLWVLIF